MAQTKTNWFAFLRSLEDITRNGKSQFTGADAFNEFINLLFLKFKEADIKKKIDNACDDESNDIFLKSAEVDEDFLIENLYNKYCKLHHKNRDKKPDPEITKKIDEQASELYSILYDFNREWDEKTVFDKDGVSTGTRIKKLNKKKKCVLRRFLHQDDFYNIAEDENISQFTKTHKMDIVNLIIKIHEVFGDKNISDVDFDAFGEGYEKYTADEVMSAKSWGQYFTRRDVIDIITEEIKPQYNEKGSDETCGTGGFLIGFDKYVQRAEKENLDSAKIKKKEYASRMTQFKNNIHGNELKWTVYKPLMLNLLCRKINLDNIRCGSCFEKENLDHGGVYDFMAGNPPFGCSFNWEPCMDEKIDIRVKNSVALILQLYLYKLKEGGRCGLVIDRGILNNGTDKNNSWEKKLRTKLINDNDLYKIILLPTGIFAHTNFATAVIFFKKGGKSKQIEFVEGYFKDEDKGKGNKTMYFKDGIVIKASRIKEKNYSLKFDDYMDRPQENIKNTVKLGDICDMAPTTKHCTSVGQKEGKYRFYSSSQTDRLYLNTFEISKECIIIGNGGCANIHYDIRFTPSKHVTACYINDDNINNYSVKYIYIYLRLNVYLLEEKFSGGGLKWLNREKIKSLAIPDISFKHQEEIVEFLDKLYKTYKIEDTVKYLSGTNIFNLLINRQYTEFENLLWYQEQIPRMMADFAQIPRMKKDYIRGLFNTVKTKEYKLGDITQIQFGTRITKALDEIKDIEKGYPVYGGGGVNFYTKKSNRNENTLVISRFGVSPECVRFIDKKFFLNDSGMSITSDEKLCKHKFLAKYLLYNQHKIFKFADGCGQKNMTTERLKKEFTIKLPSIADQKKIIEEIEKVESEQSSYAKYAEMLQKLIDQMNTTIKNICDIKQKEESCGDNSKEDSDDSTYKKKSKKVAKNKSDNESDGDSDESVSDKKSNSDSDEDSDDSTYKKKSKKVVKNTSDSESDDDSDDSTYKKKSKKVVKNKSDSESDDDSDDSTYKKKSKKVAKNTSDSESDDDTTHNKKSKKVVKNTSDSESDDNTTHNKKSSKLLNSSKALTKKTVTNKDKYASEEDNKTVKKKKVLKIIKAKD